MFKIKCFFLVASTYLFSKSNCGLAPFIIPCRSDDIDCLKTSFQTAVPFFAAGIPELGIQSTDPLIIKDLNADQGDLKLSFQDMKINGASKINVLSLTRDVEKSTMTLDVELPLLITGKYTLSGKLLFIPAEGDGDFEIKTDKFRLSVTFKYKTITENEGNTHWKVTGFDYTYDLVNKVYINFENLFNGDETRAKPILDILNNSWKELIGEVGAPIIREIVSTVSLPVNKLFSIVSTKELELS